MPAAKALSLPVALGSQTAPVPLCAGPRVRDWERWDTRVASGLGRVAFPGELIPAFRRLRHLCGCRAVRCPHALSGGAGEALSCRRDQRRAAGQRRPGLLGRRGGAGGGGSRPAARLAKGNPGAVLGKLWDGKVAAGGEGTVSQGASGSTLPPYLHSSWPNVKHLALLHSRKGLATS